MITKIETTSNSTQLTQIALDRILRELADVSRLPLGRLQKSISNPDSPIRQMYSSLLAYSNANRLCQEQLSQLSAHKEALKERKKQVQKLLLQHNDPAHEEEFRQEFKINADLEKDIEALEYKLTRIYNKCKALNKIRMQRVKQYMDQYEISRSVLSKTLHDKGHADFTDDELNDTLATLCHIGETTGVAHV